MKGSFKLRAGSGTGPLIGGGAMSPGLTATDGWNTFSGSGAIVSDSAQTAAEREGLEASDQVQSRR